MSDDRFRDSGRSAFRREAVIKKAPEQESFPAQDKPEQQGSESVSMEQFKELQKAVLELQSNQEMIAHILEKHNENIAALDQSQDSFTNHCQVSGESEGYLYCDFTTN